MSIEYTAPPQSRNEAILADTINDVEYTDPPQSRIEDLLIDLNGKVIGKQDALTEDQLAAVNSGIDSNKVEQLETLNKASSTSYNSADCNITLLLLPDNGESDSTHYDTSESKMIFKMRALKNQVLYWDTETEAFANKYECLFYGVIATNNSNKSQAMTLNIPPVSGETFVRLSYNPDTSEIPNQKQFTFTWNKSNVNVGDIWYIRPTIKMKDLEFGQEFVMYGSVYKVTTGVPCTIECATLSCTELTTELNALKAQIANLIQGGQ